LASGPFIGGFKCGNSITAFHMIGPLAFKESNIWSRPVAHLLERKSVHGWHNHEMSRTGSNRHTIKKNGNFPGPCRCQFFGFNPNSYLSQFFCNIDHSIRQRFSPLLAGSRCLLGELRSLLQKLPVDRGLHSYLLHISRVLANRYSYFAFRYSF